MKVFIDTSAVFAVLDADDLNHQRAKKNWIDLIKTETTFISTNYILIESFALIQRRLGFKALKVFQNNVLPIIHIEWVNEEIHTSGVRALFQASQKKLSLVDCISFIVMRNLHLENAFTFDRHYQKEGFHCIGI